MLPINTLAKHAITLPNSIAGIIPVQDIVQDESHKTFNVGDTHGGFHNTLNYARYSGSVEVQEETASKLDQIAQSILIDQLEDAYNNWEFCKKKLHESPDGFPYLYAKCEMAEQHFKLLLKEVIREKDQFMSLLAEIKKNENGKSIVGQGDDTGDRNYCDLYSMCIGSKINWRKLISNHGAETLWAVVTDSRCKKLH